MDSFWSTNLTIKKQNLNKEKEANSSNEIATNSQDEIDLKATIIWASLLKLTRLYCLLLLPAATRQEHASKDLQQQQSPSWQQVPRNVLFSDPQDCSKMPWVWLPYLCYPQKDNTKTRSKCKKPLPLEITESAQIIIFCLHIECIRSALRVVA